MEDTKYYVYVYSYPDGTPFYVGKGCGRRSRVHLLEAKRGGEHRKMCVRVISKILRSGQEPTITKIIDGIDNEFACFIEQEFIAKHGRRDNGTGILTNCTDGGEGSLNVAPEIKQKRIQILAEASKNKNTRFQKGHIPAMKGKRQSDETRQKYRIAQLGKKQSPETIAKRSAALKGRKIPTEQCPHCGFSGAGGSMKRWHFDNCKTKDQK